MPDIPLMQDSVHDVEAILYSILCDKGILLPKTIEDVARLEATLDLSDVPTLDPKAFATKLRIEASEVLEECDCCHDMFGMSQLIWTGKQMLCPRCI